MGVHHDMVLGGLLHHIQVVVVHRLRIVVVASWDDISHIARLDGIVAIAVHQLEGFLHVALIVLC